MKFVSLDPSSDCGWLITALKSFYIIKRFAYFFHLDRLLMLHQFAIFPTESGLKMSAIGGLLIHFLSDGKSDFVVFQCRLLSPVNGVTLKN